MISHKEVKTYKDMSKLMKTYQSVSIACKCGHKSVIPVWESKQVCSWCKNYVYRDKKEEFKHKLLKELRM